MNKITALLLVLIGLLQYRLWYGDGNVREFQRLNDRIAELHQEGARCRERNAALEAEVMDLKQGLDAVEERARQDMDMIKPGEVFVQVIDPQTEDENLPPAPAKDEKPKTPDAASPQPTESPPTAKKPSAPTPSAKAAAPHLAPKKPPKPKPPAPPKPAEPAREAPAEDAIEERPANEEPD